MEYVYHGSKEPGLKVMKPRNSTHQQKWVYASPSKAIATIFISNGGSDLYYHLGGMEVNLKNLLLMKNILKMFYKNFKS